MLYWLQQKCGLDPCYMLLSYMLSGDASPMRACRCTVQFVACKLAFITRLSLPSVHTQARALRKICFAPRTCFVRYYCFALITCVVLSCALCQCFALRPTRASHKALPALPMHSMQIVSCSLPSLPVPLTSCLLMLTPWQDVTCTRCDLHYA